MRYSWILFIFVLPGAHLVWFFESAVQWNTEPNHGASLLEPKMSEDHPTKWYYHLVLEHRHAIKNGKPSISIRAIHTIPWRTVNVITRGFLWFSFAFQSLRIMIRAPRIAKDMNSTPVQQAHVTTTNTTRLTRSMGFLLLRRFQDLRLALFFFSISSKVGQQENYGKLT